MLKPLHVFMNEINNDIIKRAYYFTSDDAIKNEKINSDELSTVLEKKKQNRQTILNNIERIIETKESTFRMSVCGKSICFVGHSQLDQWKIKSIKGYQVRNCAVSGITSFEYNEKIINSGKLNCDSDVFVVMHGTNDLVYDYGIEEIVDNIMKTIDYISCRNSQALVIFLACIHVRNRIDRSNSRIDALNNALKLRLNGITFIDMSFLDDEDGCLNSIFTPDGLHINDSAYNIIKALIEDEMEVRGL